MVSVFGTCFFYFCDILICVCLLGLSFGVCLPSKEKVGKGVLIWVFLVLKKTERLSSAYGGCSPFPTFQQPWALVFNLEVEVLM